jgi:hypothetical protein
MQCTYIQRVLNATHTQRVRTDSHSGGNQNSNLRTVDQASDERERGQMFTEIF